MSEIFKARTPYFDDPGRRIPLLIIHGTEVNDEMSRAVFSGEAKREASVHYYIDDKGNVEQYLDHAARAYHAGVGYWTGIADINSASIGIELMALSASRKFDGPDTVYTDAQMNALIPLAKSIIEKNKIAPWHVLGHQDVSCTRELEPVPGTWEELQTQPVGRQKKYDPGVPFNWKLLADNGIGLWHGIEPVKNDPVVEDKQFRMKLGLYGYDIRNHQGRDETPSIIRAFQTHFMPWNICGKVTEQSVQILDKLLEKKYEQV